MIEPISFFVPGIPKGQPRQKAFLRKNAKRAGTYTPSTADEWKARIRQVAELHLPAEPLSGPLRVDVTFYFPRPKSHYRSNGQLKENAPKWHTSKPDRDNSDKAQLDALTDWINGKGLRCKMWTDDAIVCDGRIQKRYETGQGAGAYILIREAE